MNLSKSITRRVLSFSACCRNRQAWSVAATKPGGSCARRLHEQKGSGRTSAHSQDFSSHAQRSKSTASSVPVKYVPASLRGQAAGRPPAHALLRPTQILAGCRHRVARASHTLTCSGTAASTGSRSPLPPSAACSVGSHKPGLAVQVGGVFSDRMPHSANVGGIAPPSQ